MSLADVEQIALKLSEVDRAQLASVLLDSLEADPLDHSEDEFDRRERELNQDQVKEIGHEEFVKRVNAERRR